MLNKDKINSMSIFYFFSSRETSRDFTKPAVEKPVGDNSAFSKYRKPQEQPAPEAAAEDQTSATDTSDGGRRGRTQARRTQSVGSALR